MDAGCTGSGTTRCLIQDGEHCEHQQLQHSSTRSSDQIRQHNLAPMQTSIYSPGRRSHQQTSTPVVKKALDQRKSMRCLPILSKVAQRQTVMRSTAEEEHKNTEPRELDPEACTILP
ncbi:Hypothetical predicted protein [Pelobates cultripes]|uniref:Uncharacterized protein n=1 Tax=Pelobates cultripes TaxID=61616 RepID=A0AAD1TLQ8_PELCU|nr:Hypothetical predicted protein [Pelobates cultripes]